MLSKEENELLTRVGPGTPCGELMRRYWHPVAVTVQLEENPVCQVRLLGEDLVVYRDRSGRYGLVGLRCPHRNTSMAIGIPEEEGLRCAYHGWLFNGAGKCLEMPLVSPESTFKDRVSILSYPVEEMGGLLWAYMGPQPAPLLPRWDLFVRDWELRQIVGHRLTCNWLQVMENRGDQHHGVYLHGRLFQYALEREGKLTDDPAARYNATMRAQAARAKRGAWNVVDYWPNKYGFVSANQDSDRTDVPWALGGHTFFPYIRYVGGSSGDVSIRQDYQIGVPIDDTTTWHITYRSYSFPEQLGVPRQDRVPYREVPIKDENGKYILDYVLGQDMVAWYEQGAISDRTTEHLYEGDAAIVNYRKLLRQQIELVQDGGEPMNTFWEPEQNVRLTHSMDEMPEAERAKALEPPVMGVAGYRFNFHKMSKGGWLYIDDDVDRYCPDRDLIVKLYAQTAELYDRQAGQPTSAG